MILEMSLVLDFWYVDQTIKSMQAYCYNLTIQIAYVERGTLGKSSNSRGLFV